MFGLVSEMCTIYDNTLSLVMNIMAGSLACVCQNANTIKDVETQHAQWEQMGGYNIENICPL